MSSPEAFRALVASLDRLAAHATEQVEYLVAIGVADLADELALEFDDLHRPLAAELSQLSPACSAACQELDRELSSARLGWTFADLESPEWEEVRTTAAIASAALSRDVAATSVNSPREAGTQGSTH